MANTSARMVAAYFDSRDFKYTLLGDDQDVIRTGMGGLDNLEGITMLIFFDSENKNIQIRTIDFVKIPKDKYDRIYKVCNQQNAKFRWAKFYIHEESGELRVETDAVIDLDTVGAECFELVHRITNISDEAYPDFMRAMWG